MGLINVHYKIQTRYQCLNNTQLIKLAAFSASTKIHNYLIPPKRYYDIIETQKAFKIQNYFKYIIK